MSLRRKSPCPCGSGKKFKNCCEGRKPTEQAVVFRFNKDTHIAGVSIGPNGAIKLNGIDGELIPEVAWTTSSRQRAKSPKALLKSPISPHALNLSEAGALMQYDRVFCIDTNTKTIAGRKVSVACVCECKFRFNAHQTECRSLILRNFEIHNAVGKEENLAWSILIDLILISPDYQPDGRYAIVTDSDLGQHEAYNTHETPYYSGKVLPENFTFIYASDEGRALCSDAMRKCHSEASRILNHLEAHPADVNMAEAMQSDLLTHFRNHVGVGDDFTQEWFKIP